MSNEHILDFVEGKHKDMLKQGIKPITCIQTAGDVMIVPESWGHGVLNIQESVSMATEVSESLWRIKPAVKIIQRLPDDNQPPHPRNNKKRKVAEQHHYVAH
jgi:JmjC domain, hydroxylase